MQIRTRLVDPETGDEVLERGRPGEMQITGPSVFDGYFPRAATHRAGVHADGWFRTGDLFELVGDGRPAAVTTVSSAGSSRSSCVAA